MNSEPKNADLCELGVDLQQSVGKQIASRKHVLRRRFAIAGAAGVLVVGGIGTAAANGLFDPPEVASGMVFESQIFEGRTATCVETDNADIFECTLDGTPTGSYSKGAVYAFTNADNIISGGCRGQDVAGLEWTCYVGQLAVDEEIIGPKLLGQVSQGGTGG